MKPSVVFDTADIVAAKAAALIAEQARMSVAERGSFTFAVSGGRTPWQMLRYLADEDVPWRNVVVLQVDERVAPAGHSDRNLTHLRISLGACAVNLDEQIHPMPVEADNLKEAADCYALTLQQLCGAPPVLDLVHLGLGTDGHTASLVPGDPVLEIQDSDVAVTGLYQGRQRMTLCYPILNRARCVLWVITGEEKAEMLQRLCRQDLSIPAGRVSQERAIIFTEIRCRSSRLVRNAG